MRIIELIEGEVVPFPARAPAMQPRLKNDAGVENPDFELRYVPDSVGHDWMYGFEHSEDYDEVMRQTKVRMAHHPRSDQGVGGMRYVDFVPLSEKAQAWVTSNGLGPQELRGYGKLSIIEFMNRLRKLGFTLKRVLMPQTANEG